MTTSMERLRLHKARMGQNPADGENTAAAAPNVENEDGDATARLEKVEDPIDLSVTRAEVEDFLDKLSKDDKDAKFNEMLNACGKGVVQSLAGPFGLGAFVSRWDKNGGIVDTVHNVRDGVYATEKERGKYEARPVYDHQASHDYHAHEGYKASNAEMKAPYLNGDLEDVYSGEKLDRHADTLHQEHIIPAKRVHDDPGRLLADVNGPDLANRRENLAPLNESVNTSKKQKTPTEYWTLLQAEAESRRSEIASLKGTADLTIKQEKRLYLLEKKEAVTEERLKKAEAGATKVIDGVVNRTYYTSGKFWRNTARTSGLDAAKMGVQQALGACIADFFLGVISEIKDWYQHGDKDLQLKIRLKRVVKRVANRWKEYRDVAFQGAISGLLSSLATTLINVFFQTQKRIVRMIREGAFSLIRAVKIIIFPPDGMTMEEALHASVKLIFGASILVGGIALEEVILAQIKATGLGIFADLAVTAIVSSLTAITMALSAFALDRLDIFGVEALAKHQRLQEKMGKDIRASIVESERLLADLQSVRPA
jgi:hypothetical protein